MRSQVAVMVLAVALAFQGCSKSGAPASAAAATVTLKDGSTFTGTVVKSDTSGITLQAGTGESRTYPMSQVSSVQYADQPVPATAAQGGAPTGQGNTPAPPGNKPSPTNTAAPTAAQIRTIPAGATLRVRNNEAIDSAAASAGQTFSAVVAEDVTDSDGKIAIPKGSNATLVVREAAAQGKVEGQSALVVDLGSVDVAGRHYVLETSDVVEKGKEGVGKNKRTAVYTGGGAVLGTILGAVAGGGKGAAIGAVSGAAAGGATQSLTRGKSVRIASETVLSFKLESAVQIRETP